MILEDFNIDNGIETLLDLDGSVFVQELGYWTKIVARRVDASDDIPHGISYSLTLHDKYGTRVLGYDNAHGVKSPKKFKFASRKLPYDHKHRTSLDKGVPYEFIGTDQLLLDFFDDVDSVIREAKRWRK